MSLLQDIQDFPKSLNTKYNRTDMSEVLDKYCKRIANLPQENVAQFVLQADKERWQEQQDDLDHLIKYELNEGHVYTGIMNDEELYNKFINWFEDTYVLDSDLSKYDSIQNTIAKHLDSRCEAMVVSHLLDHGLNTMKDKDTIQNALFEVDERHDKNIVDNYNAKMNGGQRLSLIFGRSFEKALQKTCYIIANQHDPLDIAEYISKDLDIRYHEPVNTEIYVDSLEGTPKKVIINEPNANRMVDTLSNSLQCAISYIYENTRYDLDKDSLSEALGLFSANDYEIEDIKDPLLDEDSSGELVDTINTSKDNDKTL